MTMAEKLLLRLLGLAPDCEIQAMVLQSYIQSIGPLSDEVGDMARKLIAKKKARLRHHGR